MSKLRHMSYPLKSLKRHENFIFYSKKERRSEKSESKKKTGSEVPSTSSSQQVKFQQRRLVFINFFLNDFLWCIEVVGCLFFQLNELDLLKKCSWLGIRNLIFFFHLDINWHLCPSTWDGSSSSPITTRTAHNYSCHGTKRPNFPGMLLLTREIKVNYRIV